MSEETREKKTGRPRKPEGEKSKKLALVLPPAVYRRLMEVPAGMRSPLIAKLLSDWFAVVDAE